MIKYNADDCEVVSICEREVVPRVYIKDPYKCEINKLKTDIYLLQNTVTNLQTIINSFTTIIGLGFEHVAKYSAISPSKQVRFVLVDSDENNNNDVSFYLYTGTELKFLQTIAF